MLRVDWLDSARVPSAARRKDEREKAEGNVQGGESSPRILAIEDVSGDILPPRGDAFANLWRNFRKVTT